MKKQSNIAQIAIFFAIMLVIHLLSSVIFNLFPVPIKPTIVHIPVIIASILYGPKVGAILGALMGIISLLRTHLFSCQPVTCLARLYLMGIFIRSSLPSFHES